MNIITFRPDTWEQWTKMHGYFHLNGELSMQFLDEYRNKFYGHVVACHPEIMAFSILLDN